MGLFTKSTRRNQDSETDSIGKEIPVWLKMLQDNSWELEILISGGAIFSLFELSDLVTDFYRTLSYTTMIAGRTTLYVFTMLATKALTLGFFLHLLLRSFWISLVALSSMFPDNSSAKPIKQVKPFTSSKSVDLPAYIVQLDKLSAWMIYNTFNMVFVITGWLLLFLILSRLEYLPVGILAEVLQPLALGAFLIYLFDLLSFSLLRKTPYLSYILYPVFKVFDIISLRFIYQKGIDYLSQHVARWKIAIFYIFFVVFASVFTYLSIKNRLHWPNIFDARKYRNSLTIDKEFYTPNYYRSSYIDGPQRVSIQSDIITEPVLNLFVGYNILYEEYIDSIENKDQRYFQNIFLISVDDSLYSQQKFYTTTLYETGPMDLGITTYIDLQSFTNGLHELKLNLKYEKDSTKNHVVIPFWLYKE